SSDTTSLITRCTSAESRGPPKAKYAASAARLSRRKAPAIAMATLYRRAQTDKDCTAVADVFFSSQQAAPPRQLQQNSNLLLLSVHRYPARNNPLARAATQSIPQWN